MLLKCEMLLVLSDVYLDLVLLVANANKNCLYRQCLQCFDAVGWAAGRASSL